VKPRSIALPAILLLLTALARGQTSTPLTAEEVGKALGFSDLELGKIMSGDVISKRINEGSDRELAGVAAVFIRKPVGQVLDMTTQTKLLETDKTIQALRVWKLQDSADEVFANVGLGAEDTSEAKLFAKAAAGDKLNLSVSEIAQLEKVLATPAAVNIPLRNVLKARYLAYVQKGLKGIAPYARGHSKSSPANELTLAIRETTPLSRRKDLFEALLNYPANQPSDVEHLFFWFRQTVEDRPTFILAHRAAHHTDDSALMTEVQFYVGHSYNANLIAAGAFSVDGGAVVFYINRTFTDQVAGFPSGTRHSIGRAQMLNEVTANLKRMREKLEG